MKTKKVNAAKNRTVAIKLQDAAKAICKDHENCVIAKAIKREFNAQWVDVGASRVLLKRKYGNRIERYLLDGLAREQVRYFDTKGQFAPCQIVLHAPPKPTGRKNKGGKSGRRNKTLATR